MARGNPCALEMGTKAAWGLKASIGFQKGGKFPLRMARKKKAITTEKTTKNHQHNFVWKIYGRKGPSYTCAEGYKRVRGSAPAETNHSNQQEKRARRGEGKSFWKNGKKKSSPL